MDMYNATPGPDVTFQNLGPKIVDVQRGALAQAVISPAHFDTVWLNYMVPSPLQVSNQTV